MTRDRQLRIMLVCSVILFAVIMGVLITRPVSDTAALPEDLSAEKENGRQKPGEQSGEATVAYEELAGKEDIWETAVSLTLRYQTGEEGLRIPLPKQAGAEGPAAENHYESKEILVILPGDLSGFFGNSVLTGCEEKIRDVSLAVLDGNTCLRIRMYEAYEYQCRTEQDMMVFTLERPADLYDRIVVLDRMSPAGNEETERQTEILTGEVMEMIRGGLEKEGIRTYCIGREGADRTEEETAAFINGLGADMLIGIGAGSAENSQDTSIRVVYNSTYVIPGFGNEQLAAFLGRHMKAAGTVSLSGTETAAALLEKVQIPAAAIVLNSGDGTDFSDGASVEELAEGIVEAVLEAYAGL